MWAGREWLFSIKDIADRGNSMARHIGLISDMGESFGKYVLGEPEEHMKRIDVAMVACGFHAGDPLIMHQTVRWCKEYGVTMGCHPGYPDLMGFGRRRMALRDGELRDYIIYQVGALQGFADYVGVKLTGANMHGALGAAMWEDEKTTRVFVDAIKHFPDIDTVYFPDVVWVRDVVEQAGYRFAPFFTAELDFSAEGFPVVAPSYESNTQVVVDKVRKWLRTGKATTVEGAEIDVPGDLILVHGDTPNCIQTVDAIRDLLVTEGVEVGAAV